MPYSGASDSSLPENVKKLPTAKKKKWVAVFNDTYNSCIDEDGSTDTCETKAFKAANGSVKQFLEKGATMSVHNREIFHRVWDGFLNSVGFKDGDDPYKLVPLETEQVEPTTRSMNMNRLWEQVYQQVNDGAEDWVYPLGIFVDDAGTGLFSVVAQSGKLFQVPIAVSQETVTLGEWIQVKEEYAPVTQNRFFVRRQKDGKYRWTAIAATSVLNRVGEIDSIKLFDSFIEQAEKRNKYPRLDFYHWGETDTDVWEFGTADYLARDGVCYIASGTFDEGHRLADATIRACEEGQDEWGCSIEFYAYAEPEIIISDPKIEIPVYNEGENTRISVVLEEDAAALFTRMGVKEGVSRSMDKATRKALEKLYGDNTEGLEEFLSQFEEGVDQTNQRVKNDKLIHRTAVAEEEAQAEESEDEDENEEESDLPELVLDESAVAALTQQMVQSEEFKQLSESITEIKQLITQSVVDRENDRKEIDQLKKSNAQLLKTVERLNKDENEKKSEYLQDLPSRKRQPVTFRARDARNEGEDADDILENFEDIAQRTLSNLPVSY